MGTRTSHLEPTHDETCTPASDTLGGHISQVQLKRGSGDTWEKCPPSPRAPSPGCLESSSWLRSVTPLASGVSLSPPPRSLPWEDCPLPPGVSALPSLKRPLTELEKAVPREPRAAWTESRAPDQNGEQTWIRPPRPSDTGVLGGPRRTTYTKKCFFLRERALAEESKGMGSSPTQQPGTPGPQTYFMESFANSGAASGDDMRETGTAPSRWKITEASPPPPGLEVPGMSEYDIWSHSDHVDHTATLKMEVTSYGRAEEQKAPGPRRAWSTGLQNLCYTREEEIRVRK
ncbi:uncharacterized protein [Muntiacus reevesi]|uniref:uncharacterized protein n=1 Tax=Muntiacus reevesi TaxID=9886 RepID=UPI0033070402